VPKPRDAAYRKRLSAIRQAVLDRLATQYRDVNAEDIEASFASFVARSAPVIRSGQRSAQFLAAAFLRSAVRAETRRPFETVRSPVVPGQTQYGEALEDGMAAIPSMVLGAIGKGKAADDALEYGSYLVGRFADSEVTATADAEVVQQAKAARIIGWNGIVSGTACPNCQSRNTGFHDWETPIYRHGACTCSMELVFG